MAAAIKIKQIDAFTTKPFTGNPAGVVLDADNLPDALMQQIANEMNLSETAFVLKSEVADFRIRWFTTEKEVLFCGHATVAALHSLAEEKYFGMEADGDYEFTIETLVGIIKTKISIEDSFAKVYLDSPKIELRQEDFHDLAELCGAIGVPDYSLSHVPITRDATVDYLFIGLNSLAELHSFDYNYSALRAYGKKHQIKGFVVYTTETTEPDSDVHSRFFSPYYDVIEDPVTGSANGPLACLLVAHGVLEKGIIKAEQGDILGRAGRLEIEVSKNEDGKLQSQLIGQAVTVLQGEIIL